MTSKHQLGRQGEAAAAAFLIQNGHQILEQNYRYLKAEVDVIALKKNCLIAVEIKTRSSDFFGVNFARILCCAKRDFDKNKQIKIRGILIISFIILIKN